MSELLFLIVFIVGLAGILLFLTTQIRKAEENAEAWKNQCDLLEAEIFELQRGYNDSQREIVILNNQIRRLKNGKMRQV